MAETKGKPQTARDPTPIEWRITSQGMASVQIYLKETWRTVFYFSQESPFDIGPPEPKPADLLDVQLVETWRAGGRVQLFWKHKDPQELEFGHAKPGTRQAPIHRGGANHGRDRKRRETRMRRLRIFEA